MSRLTVKDKAEKKVNRKSGHFELIDANNEINCSACSEIRSSLEISASDRVNLYKRMSIKTANAIIIKYR
jgi:hypothetical protein